MECYVGLSEEGLRKLLNKTTDFTERRQIRAAIRCIVQYGISTYKIGYDTNNYDFNKDYKPMDNGYSHKILEEKIKAATTEEELNELLSMASDYQDKRKIRYALRELRRKKNEEEERLNNNNNSMSSHHHNHPHHIREEPKVHILDLDGIMDMEVLQKMLEDTEEFEERRQIRNAIKALRIKLAEQGKAHDSKETTPTESEEDIEPEVIEEPKKIEVKKEEVEEEEEKEINFDIIKDQSVLEDLLHTSRDFGERAQIRAILKDLKEHEFDEPLPLEMSKKKKLSEGWSDTSDTIWLDECLRVRPENMDREQLDAVDEGDDVTQYVSYDEMNLEQLEKMLETSKEIGERRAIRASISLLKRGPEPKAAADKSKTEPAKPSMDSTNKTAPMKAKGPDTIKVKTDGKSKSNIEVAKKQEKVVVPEMKKSSAETTKQIPSTPKYGEVGLKKTAEKPSPPKPESVIKKAAEKPTPPKPETVTQAAVEKPTPPKPEAVTKKAAQKPTLPKPEAVTSKKAADKPTPPQPAELKKIAKEPVPPKPESKDVKKDKPEPAKSVSNKAPSMASKFEKPAEEPPKKPAVQKKKPGSLNVAGSKFAKFDKEDSNTSSKTPSAKPLASTKPGKKDTVFKPESQDGKTTHVTVEKTEIPGGEIVNKKTVSVSKSPDGNVTTKTTTISTTGVVEEKSINSTKGVTCPEGKTSKPLTKTKPGVEQNKDTQQVTVEKKEIPGGEIISKKTVSTSKTPDGVKIKTTSFSTTGIRSEETTTNGHVGGGAILPKKPAFAQKKSDMITGIKDKKDVNGDKTTEVTVDKIEIPGGEIVSKKTVSVSKTPDGSVMTKTTTISTSGVVSEEKTSDNVNGINGTKNGGEEFWKKVEADKKKISPMQSSSYGIGNLKDRFQTNGTTTANGSTGSPTRFGRGSVKTPGRIGQFAQKFGSTVSSPSSRSAPVLPSGNNPFKFRDSYTRSPSSSPSHTSKTVSGGRWGSPAVSPPATPTRKAKTDSKDVNVDKVINENGCPPSLISKVESAKDDEKKDRWSSSTTVKLRKSTDASDNNVVPKSPARTSKVIEVTFVEEEIFHENGLPSPQIKMVKPIPAVEPLSGTYSNGPIHKLGGFDEHSRKASTGRSPSITKEVAEEEDQGTKEPKKKDICKQTRSDIIVSSGDISSSMAPVVVDSIEDENVLEKMLEDETDFEKRKQIRSRLRDIRRKKREDREKRVNERENEMFAQMVEHRSKHKDVVLDSYDKLKKPIPAETTKGTIGSTGLTSKTTTTTKSSSSSSSSSSVSDKPKEDNNNTLIKAPTTNNNTVSKTSTSVKDDGKTTTSTTKTVKEGGGTKTETETTVSKSQDGDNKSSSIKQESTTKTQSCIGGGGLSSSSKTVTQTSSSSSSSTSTTGGKKLSKFDQQLEEKKKQREQKRLDDQAAWKDQMAKKKREEMEKRKKEKADAEKKKASIMNKFGGVATPSSMPRAGGGMGMAKVGAGGMVSASTIKQKLLEWAQQVTRGYANINITNFSSSWCDGMAFCAVVHKFYPEAFDYDKLNPKQRRKNFDLAFNSAEKYGDIMPLLETDDMLMMKNKPDWKCVFTYVQSLYRHLSKLQAKQAEEA